MMAWLPWRICAALCLTLTLGAGGASAQTTPTTKQRVRSGPAVGVGFGAAWARHSLPAGQPHVGLSFTFSFGWSLSDRFVLEGVTDAWTDVVWPQDGEDARGFNTVGLRGTYFIVPRIGIRAGAGYGQLRSETVTGRTEDIVNDWGWHGTAGITAEPFKVLGFHLSVSLDVTRFLWLKYAPSQVAEPDHPQYVSLRIGLLSY